MKRLVYTFWVKFDRVVRAASEVTDEPCESSVVGCAGADACLCKFTYGKEDIGSCVVCKIKEGANGGEVGLLVFQLTLCRCC